MDVSETVSLVVLLVAFGALVKAFKRVPEFKYVLMAFVFPVVNGIATIAEGFVLPETMNSIEHVSWALGAAVFCWAAYKLSLPNIFRERA
jgi:predicted tellurium resistance membrane protein TerC